MSTGSLAALGRDCHPQGTQSRSDRHGGPWRRSSLGASHTFRRRDKGDGADKAFLELLASEKVLDEKREKRAEARSKKIAEAKKAMEDAEAHAQQDGAVEAARDEDKEE